ncbi:MAG: hypothetical protein ACJAYX_002992 [Planctomycetota bacterium]
MADRSADIPRIAFVGGSTTYGEGVPDYHMSVPQLIELGMQHEGKQVQSINAGCPGWTSLETLLNFQMRLLDLEPDYLVFYHGINDVLPRMVWPTVEGCRPQPSIRRETRRSSQRKASAARLRAVAAHGG